MNKRRRKKRQQKIADLRAAALTSLMRFYLPGPGHAMTVKARRVR